MRYVINHKVVTSDRDPDLASLFREMEESNSVQFSLGSVRDDESNYVRYGFLPSKQSDSDCFLLGFLSISPEAEVLARLLPGFEKSLNRLFAHRYCYREGKAMKTTQIGKSLALGGTRGRNVRVTDMLILMSTDW